VEFLADVAMVGDTRTVLVGDPKTWGSRLPMGGTVSGGMVLVVGSGPVVGSRVVGNGHQGRVTMGSVVVFPIELVESAGTIELEKHVVVTVTVTVLIVGSGVGDSRTVRVGEPRTCRLSKGTVRLGVGIPVSHHGQPG